MAFRRASVDVLPCDPQSTKTERLYHVYQHTSSNSFAMCSQRSSQVLIQSLMDCGSGGGARGSNNSSNDLEIVSSNLINRLKNIHNIEVDLLKRQMIHSMQADNVNVYTIRKLVRVNGFDIESEIGPIISDEDKNLVAIAPKSHTALTWASWKGNLSLVKCLIDEGANPNTFTSEGLAAIHCSSMKNENLPMLKYFLEHPRLEVDVNLCSSEFGITPLMQACLFGAYSVVEYLLEQKADVNHQDWDGKSSIFYAVKNGYLNVIKLLVAYDACVYLRDCQHSTVLPHLIISHKRKYVPTTTLTDILIYLVEDKGLSVTNRSINGNTALHEACRRGFTDVAKFLLEKGANLEAKVDGWKTPLWSAVTGKFPSSKMIMLLLEKGANFDARNGIGMTVLQYAKLISKDESLIAVLEEAQKILRTNRMKAACAMRRAILGSGGNSTFGGGSTGSCTRGWSSYGSMKEQKPMVRWAGTQVKSETRMIDFIKNEPVEDGYLATYSHSSGDDEVPILKIEQNYGVCIKFEEEQSVSVQGATSFSDYQENLNKVLMQNDNYDGQSYNQFNACGFNYSSGQFDGDKIKESGDSDKTEEISYQIRYENNNSLSVSSLLSTLENNNNEIASSGDKDNKVLKEQTFERLLRKKKIEMMEGKVENGNELPKWNFNEEEGNMIIPQKIKRMRRCSVIILSDDESN